MLYQPCKCRALNWDPSSQLGLQLQFMSPHKSLDCLDTSFGLAVRLGLGDWAPLRHCHRFSSQLDHRLHQRHQCRFLVGLQHDLASNAKLYQVATHLLSGPLESRSLLGYYMRNDRPTLPLLSQQHRHRRSSHLIAHKAIIQTHRRQPLLLILLSSRMRPILSSTSNADRAPLPKRQVSLLVVIPLLLTWPMGGSPVRHCSLLTPILHLLFAPPLLAIFLWKRHHRSYGIGPVRAWLRPTGL